MNALGGADDKVNRSRKEESAEVVKVSDKDQVTKKKARFIWTRDVHNCFLDAIKQIGFKRAVPTKILELMNVENLTRENVASHLQKYRLQMKRRDQERAQARAASENVPKAVCPHMNGIPQQPWVLPNTKQGINMDYACLDGSQLAPSFTNHNLNMIHTFPTVQEVYGTSYKGLFDEGVNRMSSVRLVHGLYDSNGPHDINKIGYNYGPLPPKTLVDSYADNLMDRHDTTLVPQYDRHDELSLQGIISPFVPQYDRRNELSLQGIISPFVPQYDRHDEFSLQGIISPFVPQYDGRDELSLQGIISPSFVPQYDRRDELFVAGQGIISPLLAQNMEGLGVGVPRPPGGLIGMKVEGLGVSRLPEATGMKVEGRLPEATGMKVEGLGVPCLTEATGMKVEGHGVGVPRPPTGGLVGMKVEGLGLGVPRLPANGGLAGMKVEGLGAGVTHLPEATGDPGFGLPHPPETIAGLARMNDSQEVLELDHDLSEFWMNMEGDVDGKSFDELFRR